MRKIGVRVRYCRRPGREYWRPRSCSPRRHGSWYESELAQRLGVPSSSLQRELDD